MADKARHAFGALEKVDSAISSGKIDAFDILFVKDASGKPYVGWIDSQGQKVIVDNETDLSGIEAELATKVGAKEVEEAIATKANVSDVQALEGQMAKKADATEVDAKIGQVATDTVASANAYTDKMVKAAMGEHLTKKYEITSVPEGTLIDYRESEIRVMCPSDAVWTKQAVGTGGDPNSYYMTFKTYAPNDDAVGYIEHLNGQVDEEVLNKFSVDEYGRRYQPTWLALAKYDEATDTWAYYGAKSTNGRYIGYDYRIDWYDANGVMIASDMVRISLSNEGCHSDIKPYYVGTMMTEVETMIEDKITEVNSGYEVIEF